MKKVVKDNNCCKCCLKSKKTEFEVNTTEELLSLMNIYYSEWQHRDSIMWQQIFTFFFASFVITLLPFAKIWEISLTEVIPTWLFPFAGAILAGIFLYISLGYAKRLSKISMTYRELIEFLPDNFQRKQIYKKENVYGRKQLAYTIPIIMFSALILFSIVVFILCLIQ